MSTSARYREELDALMYWKAMQEALSGHGTCHLAKCLA